MAPTAGLLAQMLGTGDQLEGPEAAHITRRPETRVEAGVLRALAEGSRIRTRFRLECGNA